MCAALVSLVISFLSTPSARRATGPKFDFLGLLGNFYPRPPRGGRPRRSFSAACAHSISIHALREEGDLMMSVAVFSSARFLSTPSARRAT